MKSFLFSLVALALCGACSQNTGVTSPDGTIRLAFAVDSAGRMTYSVTDGGVRLFEPSRLGFEAAEADLGGGFAVEHVSRTSVDETWTQPWGENKENRSRYNEMAVRLRNGGGVRLTLRFRLFDDGLGFRYEYEASGADSLRVTDELTEFRFAADGDSWTIPASFDTYELLYRKLPLSELADANTPATFKVGGLYGSIHEAALYDFPEMTLRKTYGLAFKSDLAPLPDGTKAHVGNKFTTAWRTVQLAPDAVGLINSSLILNLNEPSKIGDTSWIRPMKYVGVWWGMHLGVETWAMDDRHGATTENAKRYIDFAAANNIQGVLFEGWNEGWENWGGSQSFDFTKPYADFDIAEIVRYAANAGSRSSAITKRAATFPITNASWSAPSNGTPIWEYTTSKRLCRRYLRRQQPSRAVHGAPLPARGRDGREIPDDGQCARTDQGLRHPPHVAQHDVARRCARQGVGRLERGQSAVARSDAAFHAPARRADGLHARHVRHSL